MSGIPVEIPAMPSPAEVWTRLTRPARLGLFGGRGVGKTTLLAMLYREAMAGRLPDLRLAAGDARTADHLADKVRTLESGTPLPATLAETELAFHLYRGSIRREIRVRDYQGEHVAVGSREPIRAFFRDCDAVWICLDATATAGDVLSREQEVEQLIEDHLAVTSATRLDVPMALVLTKTDHEDTLPKDWSWSRHALATHGGHAQPIAVSSFGPSGQPGASMSPQRLDHVLTWLSQALQERDESLVEHLVRAGAKRPMQAQAMATLKQRYPNSPKVLASWSQFQAESRRRRRLAYGIVGASLLGFVGALGLYDLIGLRNVEHFAAAHGDDPVEVRARWDSYRRWHPTRSLFFPSATAAEATIVDLLDAQIREENRNASLTELRRRASDPDVDPEVAWDGYLSLRRDHPETDLNHDLESLRTSLKERRDLRFAERARAAFDTLVGLDIKENSAEARVERASEFLKEFAGSEYEARVRERRDQALTALEERDLEQARAYSARNALHFQTRREHYQRYLARHPGGALRNEALEAMQTISREWDRHDFRGVRDHFLERPGDTAELTVRCETYLSVHPEGLYASSARELLRWVEKVRTGQDYRVTVHTGEFEKKVARFFSRGPDLSVEIEVNGIRHGPSPILANTYHPQWKFTFPRAVRWKLGDAVVVRIFDHDWGKRLLLEESSSQQDLLALRLLTGEITNPMGRLTFSCDFTMPTLPAVDATPQ